MKATNRDKIQMIANKRNVEWLLHFTQIANLPGIVERGILSRQQLIDIGAAYNPSADLRLDDNDKAVSVSISRMNYRMFSSKRSRSGHPYWAVLVLSSEILWERDCLFCWGNAATREIKDKRGFRGGPWAFERMFDGTAEERSGLPSCHPTDPEAEVQVLQQISPKFIKGAFVHHPDMAEPVRTILNALPGDRKPVEIANF